MSLRERNKERTKSQLGQAALDLFLAEGFDQTTVDAVAERAGVSRRTFFRYFESKEAAFFANHEERLDAFRGQVEQAGPGEAPLMRVRRACLAMALVYMSERELALAQCRATKSSRNLMAYDQSLDAAWEQVIYHALLGERSTEEARFQALVDAGAIIGTVRAVLRLWFDGDSRGDLVQLGARAFEVLMRGR